MASINWHRHNARELVRVRGTLDRADDELSRPRPFPRRLPPSKETLRRQAESALAEWLQRPAGQRRATRTSAVGGVT